jgi:hypothetical protein
VSLAIPHTPHTLSLHATNTNNATLQSASRGTRETRYGFEFTIPVTLSRYFGGRRPAPDTTRQPSGPADGTKDSITAVVQDFMFRPARLEIAAGTTIVRVDQRRPGGSHRHRRERQVRLRPNRTRRAARDHFLTPRHLRLPLHTPPLHEG